MRTDGRSALDFTYWILENVEENYQAIGADAVYSSGTDDTIMQTVIVDCAQICGVEIPRTFDALMALVDRYDTATTPETALGIRGAVLYQKGRLVVSVGDERRLVGTDIDGAVSLYRMTGTDLDPGIWDGAFLLPEMRYL